MNTFSIMSLDIEHIDEICNDIKYQYDNGIADCVLFEMALVPEYNPPIDKASKECEKFDLFKAKLDKMGIECGVLIQCTIGHGYPLNENAPFDLFTCFDSGEKLSKYCPYGKEFQKFIKDQMAIIASRHPKMILIDDDFRLTYVWGRACGCKNHINRFNELASTNYSRQELYEIFEQKKDKDNHLWDIFMETQRESLLQSARAIREGIDSVDSKIQGGNCSCISIEYADEIADIMAGENNPRIVRLNTGNYHPNSARELTKVSYRAAYGVNVLKNKNSILLAETDTCPQCRYSTSARSMHATYVADILEGANGAKHWITKLDSYDDVSGVEYRNILKKYSGFYKELMNIIPTLTWQGCRIPLPKKHKYSFEHTGFYEDFSGFAMKCLERLGLPLYFSSKEGGIAFLDGGIPNNLSDEEMINIFKGYCVLSSDCLDSIEENGYTKYIGVKAIDGSDKISYEKIGNIKCGSQFKKRKLEICDKDVVCDSKNFYLRNGVTEEYVSPASTVLKNELGGVSIVFCGTPTYEQFHYSQAFSFLSRKRKTQLIRLLKESNELEIYYDGDAEVFLKVAKTPLNEYFIAFTNLGFDTIENITLVYPRKVKEVKILTPDGKYKKCKFKYKDGILTIKEKAETLLSVILIIK